MHNILFLQNLGAGEIVIIALVILLLFGGKKIPELMKGLGKGVKSFKDGMADVEKEIGNLDEEVKKPSEPKKD
ncbi:MAG: twin-arginine translocase TatA/TatE family subunit [Bacteroidales bacterium]|nr:twin-arginine translocase TatA/TatE family subunit [Bacteroidales bacterium]